MPLDPGFVVEEFQQQPDGLTAHLLARDGEPRPVPLRGVHQRRVAQQDHGEIRGDLDARNAGRMFHGGDRAVVLTWLHQHGGDPRRLPSLEFGRGERGPLPHHVTEDPVIGDAGLVEALPEAGLAILVHSLSSAAFR